MNESFMWDFCKLVWDILCMYVRMYAFIYLFTFPLKAQAVKLHNGVTQGEQSCNLLIHLK